MKTGRLAGPALVVLALAGCTEDRGSLPTAPQQPSRASAYSGVWDATFTVTAVSPGNHCVQDYARQQLGVPAQGWTRLSGPDSRVNATMNWLPFLPECTFSGEISGQGLSATLPAISCNWLAPGGVKCPSGKVYAIAGGPAVLEGTFDRSQREFEGSIDLRVTPSNADDAAEFHLSATVKLTKR